MIKVHKKSEHVRFKNYERKIKSPFMIHSNFKSILEPADNRKQNTDGSYTKNIKNMLLAFMAIN